MLPRKIIDYCCEDISLIENYYKAIADKTQIWICHHRLETELDLSKQELIEMGLYFYRPASELILVTKSEHNSLHFRDRTPWNKEKNLSTEHKEKIAAANKGKDRKQKAVYQIDKNTGEIIKKWNYIAEAAKILGICSTSIVKCCRGNFNTAGGFIWKYVI